MKEGGHCFDRLMRRIGLLVASIWLGDHQGRPSAPVIRRFTAIEIRRVTSRAIILIILIIIVISASVVDLQSEVQILDRKKRSDALEMYFGLQYRWIPT